MTASGLQAKAKLAIGIAVPVSLFAILFLIILYWYSRLYRRTKHDEPPFESKLCLYDCQTGGGDGTPDLVKGDLPTVYHPTPALRSATYPTPMRAFYAHTAVGNDNKIEAETGALHTSNAFSPRLSLQPNKKDISRFSTYSAMRKSQKGTKPRFSFDILGRMSKRKRRSGRKTAASIENLFG